MAEGNGNPVEAGQFLAEDGVLQENWRDNFTGEEDADLKDDTNLANVKDIRGMARTIVDGQKTIGKLSSGKGFTFIPDEHSTEKEIAEHHTKLGRPESAEGYEFDKIQVPDGIPKDEKFMTKMAETLFEGGASKTLAQKLVKGYMEYTTELAASMATEDKIANAEANKQLHDVLGSTYDASIASGKLAIEAIVRPLDSDYADTLLKEMPYDVHAARFLAKVGELVSEDPGLKEATGKTGFTPADAMTKINEIMTDPYYITDTPTDKPKNKQRHDELVAEVHKLFQVKNQ